MAEIPSERRATSSSSTNRREGQTQRCGITRYQRGRGRSNTSKRREWPTKYIVHVVAQVRSYVAS
jgi:hypothetical protein